MFVFKYRNIKKTYNVKLYELETPFKRVPVNS